MKNLVLAISLLSLVGCGGSGGSNTAVPNNTNNEISDVILGGQQSKNYDLWDYIVSDTTVTKYFDIYEADSSYKAKFNGSIKINAWSRQETVLSSTKVRTITDEDGEVTVDTMSLNGNNIDLEETDSTGTTKSSLGRYSQTLGDCNLVHHNSFSLIDGHVFNDVLRLNCSGGSGIIFAKGKGVVGSRVETTDTVNNITTTSYSVSVISSSN